ncbi:MAG TPA: hypothetical protein VFB46_04020 [Gemmatimonadaceae bacterium]|nr:hypothetical protein [Gemmatimonadaceae bacterium]
MKPLVERSDSKLMSGYRRLLPRAKLETGLEQDQRAVLCIDLINNPDRSDAPRLRRNVER